MKIHTAKRGESIFDIAGEYGISPIKLSENNGLSTRERLIEGEELLILIPTRVTTARRGDSIGDIASRFMTRECDLLALNPELMGKGQLYDGQPIAVRYGEPLWGMGIGNGYFYRGCPEGLLVRALPYLNYLTVAAGICQGGVISFLFEGKRAVSLARAAGKLPLLRIYLEDIPARDGWRELISSAALLAKANDYHGITLAGLSHAGENIREAIFEARKLLMECDLVLFVEGDIESKLDYADLADGAILTSDVLHKEPLCRFEEGARVAYSHYADIHESTRAFIDISPFAYTGGKYIAKTSAIETVRRGRGEIRYVAEGDVIAGAVGKGRGERVYLWETMQKQKKLLEAVSELCYLGISFDIARTPIYELLMFRVMFSSGIGVI